MKPNYNSLMAKLKVNLARQEQAVEATKSYIALVTAQIEADASRDQAPLPLPTPPGSEGRKAKG